MLFPGWLIVALAQGDRIASDDPLLVRRLVDREPEALAECYDRYSRVVYSLALRVLRDEGEAEEVLQDVFAQTWAQAARIDPARGSVITWLLTIARSRAIDRLRSRQGRTARAAEPVETVLASAAAPVDNPEATLLGEEQRRRLRDAIDTLPVLQRVAIELAYFEGLSHSEIAERLEQPLGTVKTRIRAGLMRLREALGPMAPVART